MNRVTVYSTGFQPLKFISLRIFPRVKLGLRTFFLGCSYLLNTYIHTLAKNSEGLDLAILDKLLIQVIRLALLM